MRVYLWLPISRPAAISTKTSVRPNVGDGGADRTSSRYGQIDANDPSVWTGRALQVESSEWQRLVLRFCIRPLRGADRSWPSWISARVRSHSEIGPRRPVGSPDHERDGETVLHSSNPTRRPRRVSPTTKWS